MNMDITRFLVEGREDHYLRHFFRDFAFNPDAFSEDEVQFYVMQMRQPGNLRASLNHYGYIPQMAEQTKELTRSKLTVPMLAWVVGDPSVIIPSIVLRRLPTMRMVALLMNVGTGFLKKNRILLSIS